MNVYLLTCRYTHVTGAANHWLHWYVARDPRDPGLAAAVTRVYGHVIDVAKSTKPSREKRSGGGGIKLVNMACTPKSQCRMQLMG